MATFNRFLVLATAGGLAVFVGCGNNAAGIDQDRSGGTSAVLFKIAAAPNTPFARIADSASLTISASDMDSFVTPLSITDSTVEGSVSGIPAGLKRLFTVSVYDSLDSLQYQGSATKDLPRGATVNVPITIYRVGANAIINGTIEETAGQIPTDGLVAYYPFNGNANDESGNGNDGTVNGATQTTDRHGNSNSAYNFDGTNDYIRIDHGGELSFSPSTESFSVSLFYNFDIDGTSAGAPKIIQDRWGNNNGFAYNIGITPDDSLASNTYSGSSSNVATVFLSDYKGLWQHVVMTYSSAEGKRLFLNGVLVDSRSPYSFSLSDQTALTVGCSYGSSGAPSDFFPGKIDDIRIYSRALSAEEVTALYLE